MQRYIRLAGIETQGATQSLHVLPDMKVMEQAASYLSDESTKTKVAETENSGVKQGAA